jgi:putative transposase
MLKTHKIALNPNKTQANLFAQHCGFARVAYNAALGDFKTGLDAGEWRTEMDLRRRFNARKHEVFPWCKALSQNASKNAIRNFGDATSRWQKKQNNFPKYKKRGQKQSYQADNGANTVKCAGKSICLPKIGWVNMFECLRFSGIIKRVVISKTAHRWFASILVETPSETRTHSMGAFVIGVDVGIKHLAITSDGRDFENPKALITNNRKMRRLQRRLSRAKLRGANWYKLKDKIARLHYRIRCIRVDAHHKATTAIVSSAVSIGIESLNVAGMLKNHRLARALADASLSTFLTMLKYKADRQGVVVVEANMFYPSSKTCSSCGCIDSDLTLSDRTYNCFECGLSIDRDLNAALNLKAVAVSRTETRANPDFSGQSLLRSIGALTTVYHRGRVRRKRTQTGSPSATLAKNACGDGVRLAIGRAVVDEAGINREIVAD